MLIRAWVLGLFRRRPTLVLGTAAGMAVTVAFLAALGAFLSASTSGLTARAAAEVPVDWQVELRPEADAAAVRAAILESGPVSLVTSW